MVNIVPSYRSINGVDRHRFDADPYPTFHFGAYQDLDPTPSFTHVGKFDFLFLLLFTAVPVPVGIVLSVSPWP